MSIRWLCEGSTSHGVAAAIPGHQMWDPKMVHPQPLHMGELPPHMQELSKHMHGAPAHMQDHRRCIRHGSSGLKRTSANTVAA